jgi:hypothetical protein
VVRAQAEPLLMPQLSPIMIKRAWWAPDGSAVYYLGQPRDLRTGELLGQVTSGQWAVRQILHVDEAERVVYFTVSGLVDKDPYRRTVCRVGLDGSGFAKVTDDELDHIVTMPDTMEYFIDCLAYVRKRCWDFLVRELMGTQPPAYRPAPIAIGPELLGELFA